MTDSGTYAIIGFCVLIFLFQLIIIWYMWWMYNQMVEKYNDLNDMVIDIYNLEVIEATTSGREAELHIPKGARETYIKRHKNENKDNTCN